MWLPLAATILSANFVMTVADPVPTLDVTPSCRAISKGISSIGRDYDSCMRSEQTAKDQLAKEWSEFSQTERSSCLRASTVGGEATYTETLTCLEMARDVRKLPKDDSLTTTATDSAATGTGSRGAGRK